MVRKITSFLLVICFLSTSVLGYVPSQVVYGNEQPSEILNDRELSEDETNLDDNPTTEDEIEDKGEEVKEEPKDEEVIEKPKVEEDLTEPSKNEEEETEAAKGEEGEIGETEPLLIEDDINSEQKLHTEESGNIPAILGGLITPEILEDSLELEHSATFTDSFFKPYSERNLNLANNTPIVNMVDSKNINAKSSKTGDTNAESQKKARYTVLVLDTSAKSNFSINGQIFYTADTALKDVQAGSKKFVEDVLKDDSENHIAIVEYRGSTTRLASDFSSNKDDLIAAIDNLDSSKTIRSVAAGFESAIELIDGVEDPDAIKNVVLFTTGNTNEGAFFYSGGKYNKDSVGSRWFRSDTKVSFYAYANGACMASDVLKEKATVYTIGLFKGYDEMPTYGKDIVDLFRISTQDWASSPKHFYDVRDPEQLEFVFGEVADEIATQTGRFKYAGDGYDKSGVYFYTDKYFNESSYEYNPSLATMSLCLELSSWASSEVGPNYYRKMKNAEKLFSDIGFKDFDHNYTDFENFGVIGKPTKESIGVVAGNKQITTDDGDYTLVALAIRGGGYESEWASNLQIGAEGHHEGFSRARDQVITFLQEYIAENGIEGDIKLWITGFSRAAATANMVGGKINEDAEKNEGKLELYNCNLDMEDMYVYTFETPAGASEDMLDGDDKHLYKNIYNTINYSDPVPKVAPELWGFTRYGTNKYLPSPVTETEYEYDKSKEAMLERFETLEGVDKYLVDDFVMTDFGFYSEYIDEANILREKRDEIYYNPDLDDVDRTVSLIAINDEINDLIRSGRSFNVARITEDNTSQNQFLNDTINMLVNDYFITRENYANKYQSELGNLIAMFKNGHDYGYELILLEKNSFIINNLITQSIIENTPIEEEHIKKLLIWNTIESFMESEFFTEEDFNISEDMAILDMAAQFILSNEDTVSTGWHNRKSIGQAHSPEVCFAWLQSMDPNYTNAPSDIFTSGKYRVVRINCPVDVNVYNEKNELVASIIEDVPQNVTSIVAGLNSDGEKLIYLPASSGYRVELLATDNGKVTYSLNEFNPADAEINRLVNYYDIPVVKGQKLVGQVPAYSESDLEDHTSSVSSSKYTLATNGVNLDITNELAGDDATSAYFKINVTSENREQGTVKGQRSRQLGTFAKVTAEPKEGNIFKGWYENGTLVSTDEEYRFRVERNRDLVAKFELVSVMLVVIPSEGGTVNSEIEGMHKIGETVNLKAVANEGYSFKNWVSLNGGTFENENSSNTSFTIPSNAVVVKAIFESTTDTDDGNSDNGNTDNGGSDTGNSDNGGSDNGNSDNGGSDTDNSNNNTANNNGSGNNNSKDLSNISISNITFDKSSPEDVQVTLLNDKYTLKNIKNGDYTLVKGVDYTVSDELCTIKASYLSSLDNGKISLIFNMSSGNNPNLFITIKDSQARGDILINGKKTNLKLDSDGFVTISSKDIEGLTGMISLSIPYENGKSSDVGVLKDGNSVKVIPLSSYKDGRMIIFIQEPGVYGITNNKKYFADINKHWAENTIEFITSREIFNGYENNKFSPNDNMTRAMFATVLANLSGDDLSIYNESVFNDVKIESWYGKTTNWAYDKGIVKGRGNNLFAPNDAITREEMAVMLSNYIKYKGIVLDKNKLENTAFSDEATISPWAKTSVLEMQQYGLVSGVGNNTYAPKNNANRASVAQILRNLVESYVK